MSESTNPPGAAGRRGGGILPGTLAAVLLLMGALISFPAQPAQAQPLPSVTASIAAADKVYDGTTAATITGCSLSGVAAGDVVSCAASGAAFATASARIGITVSATVSLTGAQAGNYALSSTTASTTANITPANTTPLPLLLGDVLVGLGSYPDTGIGRGEVRHFLPDGTWVQTLATGSGSREETGMCLDPAGNLYTTNFDANTMSKFASDGNLLVASFGTGFDWHPNSCVVDAAGDLYLGLSDTIASFFGGGGVLKLDQAGNVLATFSPAPDQRGTDWVDLAADQSTLFYTSVGSSIKRFDVSTNTQLLPDFCNPCHDGFLGLTTVGPFLGLRLLPDGSVLVADWYDSEGTGLVRRYSSAGAQIQIYVAVDSWGGFYPSALALDPDKTSFWAADAFTGEIFKFDLASGAVLGQFLAGECGDFFSACAVIGLAIVGEPRAATSTSTTTVTASITAANKVYDGTTTATITGCTLSPFPVGDVSCTTTGAAFATASAGTSIPVLATVSLAGAQASGYALSSTSATTTASITPAPASVTPNSTSKVYGTADPAFTGTLTGFLPADAVTGIYSRAAGETVLGGPYLISATLSATGTLANYSITYNTALFTITPAAASVSPNAASKIEGAADPALTGTLSGFLPADGVTATYTRTAGETAAGSPYTISATLSPAAVLGNYAIANNTAGFTIIPATPSISLTKTPDKSTAAFGESVTYTYVVTNTGNVTLTNVNVVDDNGTPTYAADDFTVGTVASLAPGASVTLTRTVVPPARLCKPDSSGHSCGSLVTQHRDDGTTKFTYLQSRDDREGHADSSGWSGGRSYSSKARFRVDGLDGLSSYLADGAPGSGDSSKHANSFSLVVNKALVTKSDGSVKPPAIYHKKGWNGDWRRDWDSAHGWSDRSRKWDDDHEGYNNDDDYDMNTHPKFCPAPSTNTATVTAAAGSAAVTATAIATVQLVAPPTPSISMSKTADKQSVVFGESITYTYVVTNTGTVTLTNVNVVDDNGTPHYGADDFTMEPVAELAPGASATFTRTLVPPAKMCSTDSSGKTRSCGTFLTEHRDDGTTKFTYLQSRDRRDSYQGGGGWSGSRAYAHKTKFRVIDRYGISSHDLDGTLGTGDDSTHANLFSVVVTTSDVASADGTVMPPKLYQKKGWNGNWREDWDSNHGWSDRSHNWDDDRPSHDNDSDYDYDSNPEQCPTSATNVARVTATAGGVTVSATDKETVQIIGPPPHAPYTTHTQSGWGAKPSGSNAGKRLAERFAQVYPSGAVIGGTKTIKLTSAAAVEAFLPQAGTPAKLTQDYINPTSPISTLAGQVLALRLNVDFSTAGLTTMGFATLTVVEGELAGMTVNDVLALGNSVLGGGALPSGLKLSELAKIIGLINSNFEGGTQDDDYLQ